MPPSVCRLVGAARSTLLVDALRTEALIGWSTAGKRCHFHGTRRHSTKTPSKRWTTNKQQELKPRLFAGIRFASAWRRADVASSPKRSDSRPLLGALFGASALAYLGSSFVVREEGEEEVVTIHANESISVEEGESSRGVFHISTWHNRPPYT